MLGFREPIFPSFHLCESNYPGNISRARTRIGRFQAATNYSERLPAMTLFAFLSRAKHRAPTHVFGMRGRVKKESLPFLKSGGMESARGGDGSCRRIILPQ